MYQVNRSHPRSRMLRGLITIAIAWTVSIGVGQAQDRSWTAKIDPWVQDTAGQTLETEFIIVLEAQAALDDARTRHGKRAKGRWVVDSLRATAQATQGPILELLRDLEVPHRPYWVVNMIWARGDRQLIERLAQRPDVARVNANPWVRTPSTDSFAAAAKGGCPPNGTEPSLLHVGADTFWNQGIDGGSIVVGGQDTGYDWDHPALRASYRGWNGSSADHSYHWHDAIHSGGGVCGADSPEPCDDNGHGTHTMGTMVGDTAGQRTGMAPGAQWIGCRNMDQGSGTPITYAECFQFFLAPTDANDQNPDPDRAPDVINNSWLCPPSEGCADTSVFDGVIESLRAAGVLVVASAGNSGSSCSTISYAPATADAAFTVGAVDNTDQIASFSSRGPVTVDGSNRMKPDVSAPGVGICSSARGGGYVSLSGTSMAGPHVAGLAALLMSAQPCLRGDVDALEAYIRDTAVPRVSGQTCGGLPGSSIPNPIFGAGAMRAVPPTLAVCTSLFADGFESGDTSQWSASVP